ncbi:hypothetical protein EZV62_004518 [Acer yangbiense]|uniref:Disease resistance protein At4g27190-like leucine-rich repeats domain-containing protein n=1 Tax=Acer yangbiense TaxID=1000413 RepID=A0A5C7IJX4_9ROSI|nr:hypothetical protein EZV62_004518 [Acer yangbiense]
MILQKFPEHKFSKVRTLEPCEEVEKYAEILAQIKRLRLEKLDDLEQMWKQDSSSDLILRNLAYLEVVECNSLITLVPTLASFQNLSSMDVLGCNGLRSLVTTTVAKSLVQLERMWIKNCNEMTEIEANGDVKEDEIFFNKLRTLELIDLSNLTSFYSRNYTLNFPSLENLHVTRCPKMKFFSSGISSMPMLQQIEWGSSWTMEILKKFMEKEAEVPMYVCMASDDSPKFRYTSPEACRKSKQPATKMDSVIPRIAQKVFLWGKKATLQIEQLCTGIFTG